MLKSIIQGAAVLGLTLSLVACYDTGSYYPPVDVTNSSYTQSEASSMQYGPPPATTNYPSVTVNNPPSAASSMHYGSYPTVSMSNGNGGAASSMHYGPPSPPASSSMHYGPPTPSASAANSMHYGPPTMTAKKKKKETLFELEATEQS